MSYGLKTIDMEWVHFRVDEEAMKNLAHQLIVLEKKIVFIQIDHFFEVLQVEISTQNGLYMGR